MEVEVWLVCLLAQRNFLSHISLAVYMFQATWMCAVLKQMLCFLLLPPPHHPVQPTPSSQFCWVCFVFCFIFPLALGFFFFSSFFGIVMSLWCQSQGSPLYCWLQFMLYRFWQEQDNVVVYFCCCVCVVCVLFLFFTVAWHGPVGTVVSSLCWSLDTEAPRSESLHWRRDISGRGARVDLRCQFVQLHWETDCWRWWRVLLFKNPFYLLFCCCCFVFFLFFWWVFGLPVLCRVGRETVNVPGRLFHRHRCFFLSILLTDFCIAKQSFFLLYCRIEMHAFWMFSVGENSGGGGGEEAPVP